MKTKRKTTAKPIRKPVKPVKPAPPDDFTDIDRAMHQLARARGFKSFDDMLTNATEPIFVLGRTPKPTPEPEPVKPKPLSPYDTPVRRLAPHEILQPGDILVTVDGFDPIRPDLIGKPELRSSRPCFRPITVPRWVPFAERMPTEKDFVRFGTNMIPELLTFRPVGGIYSVNRVSDLPALAATHWLEGLQPPAAPAAPAAPATPEPKAPSATDTVDAIIAALDARGDELLANPFGPDDPPRLHIQAPLVGAAFKKAAELARKVAARTPNPSKS